MLTALIPIIMALSTQTDHIQYGMVPKNAQTFKITLSSGRSFYGAIRVNRQWVEDPSTLEEDIYQWELIPDTPWSPDAPARRVSRNTTQWEEEPDFQRKKRIVNGWRNAGYGVVETNEGKRYYPETEIGLAKRAQQMDDENNPESPESVTRNSEQTPNSETPKATASFLQQWGPHIGVSLVGLLLLTIVLKTMVLRP